MLSKHYSRLSFRGEKLPCSVYYAQLSKLSNYWNSTWLQSFPAFFFFFRFLSLSLFFCFFLLNIFRLWKAEWFLKKFLQFMTATCSLDHSLITPDQAWKHAESICLCPCRGHCSVVLLTSQHSIPSEPCYQSCASSSFERTEDLFTQHQGNNLFFWTSSAIGLPTPLCVHYLRRALLLINIPRRFLLSVFQWTAGMLPVFVGPCLVGLPMDFIFLLSSEKY